MFKFTKNISCENAQECTDNISKKLEMLLGYYAKTKDDKASGHLSIHHKNQDHTVWIFLYTDGVHESENTITKKIVKQKSDMVKKFTGTIPTESEIKKII